MDTNEDNTSHSKWYMGVIFILISTIIGGISRVIIRKSWILTAEIHKRTAENDSNQTHNNNRNTQQQPDVEQQHPQPQHQQQTNSYQENNTTNSNTNSSRNHTNSNFDYANGDTIVVNSYPDNTYKRFISVIKLNILERYDLILRLIGFTGLFVIDPIFGITAMSFASPSIIAPLGSLMLVWVIVLSSFTSIKNSEGEVEKPSAIQIIACCIIVFGEMGVAAFGDHTNNDDIVSIEDVRLAYLSNRSMLFFSGYMCWMLFLCIIIMDIPSTVSDYYYYYYHYDNLLLAPSQSYFKPFSPTLKRFAWGVVGGSLNGLLNFTKDPLIVFDLLWKQILNDASSSSSSSSQNSYSDYYIYYKNIIVSFLLSIPWWVVLFSILGAALNFGSIWLLSSCMKRYDATYSSAMNAGSQIMIVSIMSVFHYNTIQHLNSIYQLILYPLGLIILILGIWIMATTDTKNDDTNNNGIGGNNGSFDGLLLSSQSSDDSNHYDVSSIEFENKSSETIQEPTIASKQSNQGKSDTTVVDNNNPEAVLLNPNSNHSTLPSIS